MALNAQRIIERRSIVGLPSGFESINASSIRVRYLFLPCLLTYSSDVGQTSTTPSNCESARILSLQLSTIGFCILQGVFTVYMDKSRLMLKVYNALPL